MAHASSSQKLNQFGTEALGGERGGKLHRLAQILRGDLVVNISVVLALAVGFFHGWLKLKIRHPATTFAFDVFLLIALVLVYLRCGSLTKFIPPGPVGKALLALYGLLALYLPFSLIPGMPPFLVAVVAIRSWAFGTLMYCVGYHTIRSPVQMRAFYFLTIGLALMTSIYGLRQSPEEILAMMEQDEYYAQRFVSQTYATSQGAGFRIFSTFVSSAAYGGTLACTLIFALAFATDRATRPWLRWSLYAVMVPLAYGVAQSGSRSALAAAALGGGAVLLLRRQWAAIVLTPAILAAAVLIAGKASGGALLERFSELSKMDSVALRFLFPALIGVDFILDGHPLGGGLGKAGFVPMFLAGRTGYTDYVGADGDLGKLLIELGIPGLVVFGWLLWTASRLNWDYVRRHAASPIGTLLIAGAANFFISILTFPIGSPYIGIPLGVLVWFMIGGSQKLVELQEAGAALAIATTPAGPVKIGFLGQPLRPPPSRQPASHGAAPGPNPVRPAGEPPPKAQPRKRFLYLEAAANPAADQPASAAPPAPDTAAPVRPKKRFFYLSQDSR